MCSITCSNKVSLIATRIVTYQVKQQHWALHEIADKLQLQLRGDQQHTITGIGTLLDANSEQIAFLANPGYRKQLATTRAGAVILSEQDAQSYDGNCLISSFPYVSYASLADWFAPDVPPPSIHPSANIDASAQLEQGVAIGANSVIGPGCRLGRNVRVAAGCVLESNCSVANDSIVMANVWIGPNTRIGQRARIHPGAVLGSDGFGLAWNQDHWKKVPQLGGLLIGDDCEIGANTTIDRGSIGDTVLHQDVRLDNQIQIAHNVEIGAHTAIAACTGIAGSTKIGAYCLIGGACGIGGHLQIGDRITLTGMSMVTHSLHEPGNYGSAIPAAPEKIWHRNIARLRQLDKLWCKLKRIDK